MDQELLPLSEAKTRLHEVVKDAERRDLVLLRHGRPVGVLLGYRRYRDLLEKAARRESTAGGRTVGPLATEAADIERLCRRYGVRRLSAFGSATRGDDDPSSDVDLLVELAPMPPAARADAFFDLHADLERLLGRRVDLLEESAVTNPYLAGAIDRDRVVLYDAA